MSELDTPTARFEARLGRLERNYRRMTVLATLFASLAVVATLTGQSSGGPTIVGDPRGARTSISPNGVIVYDASGTVRLDMTIDDSTPGFGVHGPDGKYVLEANGSKNGAWLRIGDGNIGRAYFGIYTDGRAGMQITNGTGKLVVAANEGTTGGFLRLRDSSGTERAYMGLNTDGSSSASMSNAGGTTTWHAP